MKTCKMFQKFIERIAEKNGFDLYTTDPDRRGYVLRVEVEGYMPLEIAVLAKNVVAVSHIK